MFPDRKPLWRQDPWLVVSPLISATTLLVAGLFVGYWWVWATGVTFLVVITMLLVLDVVVTRRGNRLRAEIRELIERDYDGTL